MSILQNITPESIDDTPLGISIYTVTKEATHYHKDTIELIYCLQGNVSVITSYETIDLSRGEILLINCNEVHGISSEENNLLVSFYLNMGHPVYREQHFENIMLRVMPDTDSGQQKAHFKELNDLLLSVLYLYLENQDVLLKTFIDISHRITKLLMHHFNVYHIANENADLAWSQERFEQILLYINTNYHEKITLKMLSEREHLNYNYLSLYFNRTFNDTFNNYLNVIRVYHSELMLLTTHDTVSSISWNCGFSAPKFYYKAFRKWYGATPAEHRRRHREYNAQSRPNRIYHVQEIYHTVSQYITYYFSKSQFDSCGISIPPLESLTPGSRNYAEKRIF